MEPTAPAWFADPDRRFRPAAFWFWPRLPAADEIDAGLADMARAGIMTVMVQARLGLPLADYLSDAWFAAWDRAVDAAGRLGMAVTVYDDYNWMSGHGGGRTVAGRDDLRERHLFWARGNADPAVGPLAVAVTDIRSPFLDFLGPAGRAWCLEGGRAVWGDWQVVAAVGPGGEALPATVEPAGERGAVATVDVAGLAQGAAVTVFLAARCETSRLVNYLRPETAERFADVVHARYARHAARRPGVVDGFFFDHPYAGFQDWDGRFGMLGNSLLWDEAVLAFPTVDAAGLGRVLLAVVDPAGDDALRAAFLEDYAERMHAAFFGTLRRRADALGLGLTGHELLTHVGAFGLFDGLGGVDPRVMPGVDPFAVDAFRTATAVDACDYAPQVSARIGDSVARANGRSRCVVEQYSTGRERGRPGWTGQWDLTLERLRAQAVRHTLAGARQFLFHAVYLDDGRAPDGSDVPNPRFDFPPGIDREPWWADCSAVFAELARLSAFLEDGEPVRPVALLHPLETIRAGTPAPACGRHFGWWAKALAEAGVGHEIVSEGTIAAGALVGRSVLLLPAVEALADAATAAAIAAFADAGGRVVASGPLPARAGRNAGARAAAAVLAGRIDPDRPADEAAVRARVAADLAPLAPVVLEGGPTWCAAMRVPGALRLAILNDADRPRILRPAEGRASATRWHPEDGRRTEIGWDRAMVLGAQEILCVEVADGVEVREANGRAVREGDGAAVPVDAEHSLDTEIHPSPQGRVRAERGGGVALFPVYPPVLDRIEAQLDQNASGPTRKGDPFRPSGPLPASESPASSAFGFASPPEGKDDWQPHAITPPLHPAPPPAEADPIAVIDLPDGWTLAVPGAGPVQVAVDRGWEVQGFAAFSGTGTYRRTVDLPFPAAWTLDLPAVGETVTARLDGVDLGTRVAGARRFALGIRAGRVVLELDVRNTAANRYHQGTPLAAAPPPSGLLAPPRLLARRS
ncbi:hypothetical protein [Oharaeibacter diazotrophicus]|uniref:Alpha-L-rhamnosidase-like protein n=1 Tax=Oharaeibacter diazotrophicus TaxID=1920512 RepID=A0A4R6R5L4_9HYPH|nr:hypothetical protein [Oharaeibacter diazotrophicus]TDP81109.1 hypothetical protein EDD54_4442 [Oharaeibacter diazotrophicus]BBE74897.1 hypothetical protein OHA_2_00099 [Pleomorphomonas sp. SM30]GLS75598.1 hypothetical protein GCM10007904_09330 [Oharaeibacter diazotrophicus]